MFAIIAILTLAGVFWHLVSAFPEVRRYYPRWQHYATGLALLWIEWLVFVILLHRELFVPTLVVFVVMMATMWRIDRIMRETEKIRDETLTREFTR